jgi:hypothetical protein
MSQAAHWLYSIVAAIFDAAAAAPAPPDLMPLIIEKMAAPDGVQTRSKPRAGTAEFNATVLARFDDAAVATARTLSRENVRVLLRQWGHCISPTHRQTIQDMLE